MDVNDLAITFKDSAKSSFDKQGYALEEALLSEECRLFAERLASFAKQKSDMPSSPKSREQAIPAIVESPLPAEPPLRLPDEIPDSEKYEVWRKTNGRDIVKFLRHGWPAPFIEASLLTRPALFHLDHSAWKSIVGLFDRGKSLPDDIYLPDRSEVVARSHAQKEEARRIERQAAALRKAEKSQGQDSEEPML